MFHSSVYAKLGRGGLGNKMLIWARALIFAKKNDLPFFVSHWAQFKYGPYLRMEKNKRQYWGYFSIKNKPGFFRRIIFFCFYKKVFEQPINDSLSILKSKRLYIYNKVPHWDDYFKGLRGHEIFIRKSFFSILSDKYKLVLSQKNSPVIAVHIRQGDFRELKPGEIFGSIINTRTPIDYYIRIIKTIRSEAGQILPVTIFTDGHKEDVQSLLELPNVQLAEPNADIVDLYMISKAKCIVTSTNSTFSYWAAFLSDALVITNPSHKIKIRSKKLRNSFFEGPLYEKSELNNLFRKKIRAICISDG